MKEGLRRLREDTHSFIVAKKKDNDIRNKEIELGGQAARTVKELRRIGKVAEKFEREMGEKSDAERTSKVERIKKNLKKIRKEKKKTKKVAKTKERLSEKKKKQLRLPRRLQLEYGMSTQEKGVGHLRVPKKKEVIKERKRWWKSHQRRWKRPQEAV